VFDKDGVLDHINGKGYIDMSTVDADTSSKISEVGIPQLMLRFIFPSFEIHHIFFSLFDIYFACDLCKM